MSTYTCKRCGWSGKVQGRRRCLRCSARRTALWRKRNPDKARLQRRRWEARFRRDRRDEYNRRRRLKRSRARMREAYTRRRLWLVAGDVTAKQLQLLYRKAGGACAYCGRRVERPRFTPTDPRGFDHVQSRQKGGKHTIGNIVVCCASCNAIKG